MNRRKFIAAFGKVSLVSTATTATAYGALKDDDTEVEKTDILSKKLKELKKRVDSLEDNQKMFLKAMCVVTAVSTGIDLSILL